MKSSASKIQLTGYDALFQTSRPAEANGNLVQEVPLSELFPFKNHPFQVRDDEAMQKTVESIARSGVLSPGIVRPRSEGGYEIIAGHRRKRGSELAGKTTMPVLIRMLDDDEATIIMVDSNLQREKIQPSEKAFAYNMKLEALKHQGKRRDLTSEPAVPKLTAREKIAQDAGENCGLTVTRYIALTRPIPPLLALVDEDKLAVSTAADYISDLAKQEQTAGCKYPDYGRQDRLPHRADRADGRGLRAGGRREPGHYRQPPGGQQPVPLSGTLNITGTAAYGQTLTASYAPSNGETVSYQWNRGSTAISGASGSTYTLTTADIGQQITVTATPTDTTNYTGILDRVLHHCTVINIKGDSYRLKERKEFMRQKQQIVNTLFQQGNN